MCYNHGVGVSGGVIDGFAVPHASSKKIEVMCWSNPMPRCLSHMFGVYVPVGPGQRYGI